MPQSTSPRKSFTALLEPDGTALKWVIARVPFDIAKTWPVRNGRRVRGEIGGFAFRTSLFPDSRARRPLSPGQQEDAIRFQLPRRLARPHLA